MPDVAQPVEEFVVFEVVIFVLGRGVQHWILGPKECLERLHRLMIIATHAAGDDVVALCQVKGLRAHLGQGEGLVPALVDVALIINPRIELRHQTCQNVPTHFGSVH